VGVVEADVEAPPMADTFL
jgi:hypothetical protein